MDNNYIELIGWIGFLFIICGYYLNAKKLADGGLKDILVSRESLFGKFLHKDVKVSDEEEGTFKIGTELNDTIIQKILGANIYTLEISVTNSINKGPYLLTTILNDKNNTKDGISERESSSKFKPVF